MGECCGGGWQEAVEQALDGALQVNLCILNGLWVFYGWFLVGGE